MNDGSHDNDDEPAEAGGPAEDDTADETPTVKLELNVPVSEHHMGMANSVEVDTGADLTGHIESWLEANVQLVVESRIHDAFQETESAKREAEQQRQQRAAQQQAAAEREGRATPSNPERAAQTVREPQQPAEGDTAADDGDPVRDTDAGTADGDEDENENGGD
jgi:hypothetical protein